MAEIPGKSGSVAFTNFSTSVKSFTINNVGDVEEITDFADGGVGYKKYLPTLNDWTATLEMNWDSANTALVGAAAAELTLTVDGTSSYTGSAILVGITVNEPVGGVVTCTGNFQGNGLLTLS